jgi:hypothetical protein
MRIPPCGQDTLQLILNHISELGWDGSAFSDDALANKRILPGFVFKHISDKCWSERGRVTPASMTVMVRHVIGTSGPQPRSNTAIGSVGIGGIWCSDPWGSVGSVGSGARISGDRPLS